MKINGSVYFEEMEFDFVVKSYSPYRPAPACSDHDSPKWADCGDDEEVDFDLYLERIEKKMNLKTAQFEPVKTYHKITDSIFYELAEEQVCEWCRENMCDDGEDPDAYDRWRDEQSDRERD